MALIAAAFASLPSAAIGHPWVPNDAVWPWNMTGALGNYTNSNGGTSYVECLIEVGSDNPSWQQENLRDTRWAGGARCNVQMGEISGSAQLYQWSATADEVQVDSATIDPATQHEVPEGHGFGWEAHAIDRYNRTSNSQFLQIHVQVVLRIQPVTGSRWTTYTSACQRDVSNGGILRCELWSPPFQHAPYPCGGVFSGSYGMQPFCTKALPCPTGQYGVQPYCFDPASIPCYSNPSGCVPPPCPSGQIGRQPFCSTPPPTGPCPSGQIGIGGTCLPPCPSGQVGWGPACYTPPPPCPNGQVGVGGNCVPVPQPGAPTNTSPPTVIGRAKTGEVLTAAPGTWTNGPNAYTYQWQRCTGTSGPCSDIPEGKADTYVVRDPDVGFTLRVVVTARNAAGTSSASSARTAMVAVPGAPVNLSPPQIGGAGAGVRPGTVLTATPGSWDSEAVFTYQWELCFFDFCSDIRGAVADRYVVQPNDVGGEIRVAVTARNTAGSGRAVSARVGPVEPITTTPSEPELPPWPLEEACPYGAMPEDVPAQHGCEADD